MNECKIEPIRALSVPPHTVRILHIKLVRGNDDLPIEKVKL